MESYTLTCYPEQLENIRYFLKVFYDQRNRTRQISREIREKKGSKCRPQKRLIHLDFSINQDSKTIEIVDNDTRKPLEMGDLIKTN